MMFILTQELRRFVKEIPLEVVCIGPLFLVWILINTLWSGTRFFSLNGMPMKILLLSLFSHIAIFCMQMFRTYTRNTHPEDRVKKILWNVTYGTLGFLFFLAILFLQNIAVKQLFMGADPVYTEYMSFQHIQIDPVLQVSSVLQHLVSFFTTHDLLLWYVYFTYTALLFFVLIAMFVLPIYSLRVGREYVLALYIAMLLSLPLWLMLPTVGPVQLAISNIFPHESGYVADPVLVPLRSVYEENKDTVWGGYVTEMVNMWNRITKEGRGYAVSNNPSMHVIWGIILTFYLARVNYFLGVSMGIFTIGEIMGTLVFLQHYTIDLVTGVGVAYLTIALAHRLLHFEETHMHVNTDKWFVSVHKIRSVICFMYEYINTKINWIAKKI
ncbi:MAG: phosphatase PAP2 family protein [Candidatus Pacebacteria bacterium]|nr:phosphatase PAP2 family protein [Candidatus Paceibacterota bacterium]